MIAYAPPVDDFKFILHEVLRIGEIDDLPSFRELDAGTVDAIIDALGQFAAEVVAPANEAGDRQGCRLEADGVVTAAGFAGAYQGFAEGGWASLTARPEDGGQGLPHIFLNIRDEMFGGANLAFAMGPAPASGFYEILKRHASDAIRRTYIPNVVSGRWAVAMSLTEPQCGSALGLIRTRAEPVGDGSHRITGTKMFNSWGDHDMAENIVHLVLARLPDAPSGTRGISLFLVPKFLPDASGRPGERNGFSVGSVEQKMGIHGSPTCVTNFDGATGYLVGAPNQGLPSMFIMMNAVRLATGVMATGMADATYRHALAYSRERIAGRSPSGAKYPDLPGDPIIVHPDVRRMLMTMRAFSEGARLLCLWVGLEIERSKSHEDAQARERSDAFVSLLTPVVKSFLSDKAFEMIDLALQCFGGHGYIRENGVEQYLRDERMLRLGEGTSGIQAMDLLGRKVLGDNGEELNRFFGLIRQFADEASVSPRLGAVLPPLRAAVDRMERLTQEMAPLWRSDPDEVGAASNDYLGMLGHVSLAFMWAKLAHAAGRLLDAGEADARLDGKIATAEFYMARILPEIFALEARIRAGASTLMRISDDAF